MEFAHVTAAHDPPFDSTCRLQTTHAHRQRPCQPTSQSARSDRPMPGGGTTATAQAPPNEAVLQAIEAADGAGVTVAAVTAATGFPTDVVEAEMAALLRACNGFFAVPESASAQDDPSTKDPQAVEYRAQVLDTAGVQYVYPKGLRSFLWRRSFGLRLRACAATVGAAAFAVLRISFGVLLLLSLAVVVAVMLVLIARAGGAAGDRHSREGLEGAFRLVRHRRPLFDAGDLYWWMWWREWWLQNPFFYGWDAQQQHRMRQEAEERRRWVLARLDEEEGGGAVSISRASSRGSSSGSDESAGSAVGTRSRRAPSVPMMVHHRRAPTAGSRAYDALEDEEQELEDEGEEDMSFFESVFSLLFGDGRPGPSENERWQRVGRLIHDKRGVVVAEEVVPLLTDAAEADLDRSMLPVLERFGGKPVRCLFNNNEQQPSCVTEEAANSSSSKPPAYIWDFARMREACLPAAVGRKKQPLLAVATPSNDTAVQGEEDKAALIPQQQASLALVPVTVTEGAAAMEEEEEDEDDDDGASGAATASDYGPLPAYLQEKRHRFSRAPLRHLQMAGALGLVNLVGAMWLLDQWRAFPPPVAAVLYPISRALALYAWTFLLLPLLRLALIARWNRALARRNALRRSLHEAFKTQAADAESEVCRKLEWAARYRAHVAGAGVRF